MQEGHTVGFLHTCSAKGSENCLKFAFVIWVRILNAVVLAGYLSCCAFVFEGIKQYYIIYDNSIAIELYNMAPLCTDCGPHWSNNEVT